MLVLNNITRLHQQQQQQQQQAQQSDLQQQQLKKSTAAASQGTPGRPFDPNNNAGWPETNRNDLKGTYNIF